MCILLLFCFGYIHLLKALVEIPKLSILHCPVIALVYWVWKSHYFWIFFFIYICILSGINCIFKHWFSELFRFRQKQSLRVFYVTLNRQTYQVFIFSRSGIAQILEFFSGSLMFFSDIFGQLIYSWHNSEIYLIRDAILVTEVPLVTWDCNSVNTNWVFLGVEIAYFPREPVTNNNFLLLIFESFPPHIAFYFLCKSASGFVFTITVNITVLTTLLQMQW